jgi:RHS repeat-associated protein
MTLGNLAEYRSYDGGANTRLQLTQIVYAPGLTLNYYYCPGGVPTGCASNNGNLQQQDISRTVGSTNYAWTQTYVYDQLDRLTQASESGTGSWSESYGYDPFGNRWAFGQSGLPTPVSAETPTGQNWYNPATNQLTGTSAPTGWGYADGRGNVTAIGGMLRSFTYDAENRLATSTVNGVGTTNTYDGDGRRVMKSGQNGTPYTYYVYDALGQLAAEYSSTGPTSSGTIFLAEDHLGSTRQTSDSNGNNQQCHDYKPFGEDLQQGTGGRTTCYPASANPAYPSLPDVQAMKFTGKERDAETGMDYFGARHLSGGQGRFMSADIGPFHPENPQSWNRYVYAVNNPLFYVDPDGQDYLPRIYLLGSVTQDTPKRTQTADPMGPLVSMGRAFMPTHLQDLQVNQSNGAYRDLTNNGGSCNFGCLSVSDLYPEALAISFTFGVSDSNKLTAKIHLEQSTFLSFLVGKFFPQGFSKTYSPVGGPETSYSNIRLNPDVLKSLAPEQLLALFAAARDLNIPVITNAIQNAIRSEQLRQADVAEGAPAHAGGKEPLLAGKSPLTRMDSR